MIKTARVYIWGEFAGAVAWEETTKIASFEYDRAFLRKGIELAPLKMPITSGRQIFYFPELSRSRTFNGLPGLLADSLPDRYGNQLIKAWPTTLWLKIVK